MQNPDVVVNHKIACLLCCCCCIIKPVVRHQSSCKDFFLLSNLLYSKHHYHNCFPFYLHGEMELIAVQATYLQAPCGLLSLSFTLLFLHNVFTHMTTSLRESCSKNGHTKYKRQKSGRVMEELASFQAAELCGCN